MILRTPIFITNTEILQVKRFRVTGGYPFRSPVTIDRPVGIFDQVKSILNPFIKLLHGDNLRPPDLTRKTGIQDWHRLSPQVFTEQEIFVETKAVRLKIDP